jgi:hypothetical protein
VLYKHIYAKRITLRPVRAFYSVLDILDKVRYNKFLREQKMQTATKQKIDSLMLQLQDLLEDEYSENDAIQTAFNDLAIVLDDVVN